MSYIYQQCFSTGRGERTIGVLLSNAADVLAGTSTALVPLSLDEEYNVGVARGIVVSKSPYGYAVATMSPNSPRLLFLATAV